MQQGNSGFCETGFIPLGEDVEAVWLQANCFVSEEFSWDPACSWTTFCYLKVVPTPLVMLWPQGTHWFSFISVSHHNQVILVQRILVSLHNLWNKWHCSYFIDEETKASEWFKQCAPQGSKVINTSKDKSQTSWFSVICFVHLRQWASVYCIVSMELVSFRFCGEFKDIMTWSLLS